MRILVVEDEKRLAQTLRDLLHREGYTVDVCYSGTEGLDNALSGIYDLMLLDVMLPGLDGFTVLERLRGSGSRLPVLMLTARGELSDRVCGLDRGADYYLTKPFDSRELVACINALLRRKVPERAKSLLRAGSVTLDPESCQVKIGGSDVEMGNSEFRLLKFLMANPDRVFSRSQLLDKVWSNLLDIEERTVDVHVLRLRKALKGQENLVRTVRGMGYMLSEKDKSE